MSRRNRSTLEMGHDSFLDIVANLVGILIILVVVLGTQSQSVIRQINEQADADAQHAIATDQQLAELGQHTLRAQAAQADSVRFENQIKRIEDDIEIRKRQRGILLDLLSEAEAAWDETKSEFDERKTKLAQRSSELQKLESDLADLQGQRERLENQRAPVIAVQHLPTPMAKTVFGEEIHFRLKGNRLSVVPIEKLISEIRDDFKRVASGPRQGRMDSAVGPVRGYVARYVMDKRNEVATNGGSIGTATRVQLVHMVVEPLKEPHGDAIQEVLVNSQAIDIELAGRQPNATTITVWVYPDSFGAFRKLKEHLYAKGYATAARPLTMDRPITGGPQGSRSAAQ